MDLRDFYFENIQKTEWHYRFIKDINEVGERENIFTGEKEPYDITFEIYDVEEAIDKFRKLCEPSLVFDQENTCWFYLVTYYLHKNGYEIVEFPQILARPPKEPGEFATIEIRKRIIANGDATDKVAYATRREYVKGLTFKCRENHIEIDDWINQKFVELSNRSASFCNMSMDEKLAEITNLIENLLKRNGSFVDIDYSKICFDYITENDIKSYRKKMHCFRHATEEALAERKTYTDNQKNFFVDYGLTIVKVIYSLSKELSE